MRRAGLSELTAFIAIAEQRSFRAAARQLGVSPSALSHAIRNLEARLDARLFNRTTRSVGLTEVGERLLRRVQPAMADLDDAINEVGSDRDRPSGSIRISAAESGAKPLIQHVLPQFLSTYPGIHVEVVVDTRMVDIVADGFDAGVRLFDDVPRDMVAVRFGSDLHFVAVASPAYLSRHQAPSVPQDLAKHRCIRFRFLSGALYRWNLQRHDTHYDMDVDGPMTLGNTNLMVDAALAGIGIAWLPDYQVEEHLASGRLVHVLPEWSPSMPGVCLYYPQNRHPPVALRLFTQAVREWAALQAAQRGG
ncbi:MAG TPA: LysR family transcriptional regulator [Dyella sp.]|uniref:LysR family transcriptional regulator n=1 Tax=Dyella sp. TaxID=1869338 RepID=UPI002C00E08A|nr:LysR family transcriptional regulator [Dyella sp.]HUB90679.1 LysR family transcriptional regulator [Dyella sp.]